MPRFLKTVSSLKHVEVDKPKVSHRQTVSGPKTYLFPTASSAGLGCAAASTQSLQGRDEHK